MTARRGGGAVAGGVTASRRVAAEVCADLRAGALLDTALDRRAAALDPRDRRWVLELLAGMLRRRAVLDAMLAPCVRGGLGRLDPEVLDLLRLGAQQLLGMDRVPAYAAIAQTVELAKGRHGRGAAGLVNAVLRRVDRERDALAPVPPEDPVAALALAHSHPHWLVARWVARWGTEDAARLLACHDAPAPVIARPYGAPREALVELLEADGVTTSSAPLVPDGIQLGAGVPLTQLAAFRGGRFFVQDPAATCVTRYAAVPPGSVVLDACAAPGGKALELSRTARLVVAADRQAARLGRLRANVARVGATNVRVIGADARHPAVRPVDAVLLDAPCSGTGTMRRHPDARWRLKPSDLAVTAAQQRGILDASASVVRPGGLLVYATCSLEPEENDAQVERFLASHPAFTLEPPPAGAVPPEVLDGGLLRVLPHRHGTDGAFAARLRRGA